jgi:hypothetical protein
LKGEDKANITIILVECNKKQPYSKRNFGASGKSCQQIPLLFGRFLVSGAGFEPDGGVDEAEGLAHLVGEKALEGEVGEEDEAGRVNSPQKTRGF